jgi:hypothetical protein
MPAEQRGRGDEERRPPWRRQQPGQCGEHRPINGLKIGTLDLAAQDRDLMPQHQDLYLVGAIATQHQERKVQQLAQDQIPERQDHDLSMTTKAATAPDKPHVRPCGQVFERYRHDGVIESHTLRLAPRWPRSGDLPPHHAGSCRRRRSGRGPKPPPPSSRLRPRGASASRAALAAHTCRAFGRP